MQTSNKWLCPLCKSVIDTAGSTVSHYKDEMIKFHLNLHSRHTKEDLFKALSEAAESKTLPPVVAEKYDSFFKTVELIEAEFEKLKLST